MRVSVAMCVYNGAKYLPAQLQSIAAGELLPDDLVVCDDGSTDESLAILDRFAASAPFAVHVHRSAGRLGSSQNFGRAIGLCRGDVIALADQDDVWLPNKLACLVAPFADPAISLTFSDADVVDDELCPLGYRQWQAIGFDRGMQRQMATSAAIDLLLKQNVVTGATMAFRAELRQLILPIGPHWVHDGWITLLATATGRCQPIDQPLILYRQHARQQIGQQKMNLLRQYRAGKLQGEQAFRETVAAFAAARDRLATTADRLASPATLNKLDKKVRHFEAKARMRAPRVRRWPLIARELRAGHYAYSLGWKSLAQDLFL